MYVEVDSVRRNSLCCCWSPFSFLRRNSERILIRQLVMIKRLFFVSSPGIISTMATFFLVSIEETSNLFDSFAPLTFLEWRESPNILCTLFMQGLTVIDREEKRQMPGEVFYSILFHSWESIERFHLFCFSVALGPIRPDNLFPRSFRAIRYSKIAIFVVANKHFIVQLEANPVWPSFDIMYRGHSQ